MNKEEIEFLRNLVENEELTHAEKANRMENQFGRKFNHKTIGAYAAKKIREGQWIKFTKAKSTEIREDGSQVSCIKLSMTEEQSKDPNYVLKAHGYDPEEWQVVNLVSNLWEQNNSEKGLVQLYQSKISVKPKTHEDMADIIEALVSKVTPIEIDRSDACIFCGDTKLDRNLVINITDVHMGIVTYEDLRDAQAEIISHIKNGYGFVAFNIIGDLVHNDSLVHPTTTRGTIVDQVDMIQAIEDLKLYIEPMISEAISNSMEVEVHYIPGNHDLTVSYMFMQYLQAAYSNTNVDFDIDLRHRKAYLLENVLIGIAHGDLSRRNLPMLLATEFPELWGAATTREYFVGHFHSEKKEVTIPVEDKNGVTVRQLSTLKKSDYYELKNGYTTSRKKLQLFEFDSNELKVTYEI